MINDKGEEVGIIYGWYNTKNEKWYIGQTINPEDRFNRHIHDAIDINDNNYFHRALRKYGLDNFVYCVLEENILRDNLNMKEQEWIEYYDSFHSGYNLTLGGDGVKGVIMTEDVRKRISESSKKRTFSTETRKRMSESAKGRSGYWKGKHRSKETKKKLSEKIKGQHYGCWKGKHFSEEHKRKLSEAYKRRTPPNIKKVNKYDLNGNFIKKYDCMKDAVKENPKASNISAVCKGKRKQAGGFIWKFAS